MFHPSRACSTSPFQVFSFSCSRNHSATPCFIRRTRTVVALTPSMTAGSSVANSGIPCRDSFFSSLSALKVSRPERSMSSHTTAANFGAGPAASASRSAIPPSRGSPAPVKARCAWPRPRCSRSRPPDSMSQYQAAMNQPGGSQAREARICRFSEARGSCISRVEVRPRNATGTGSGGPPWPGAAAEATSFRDVCRAGVAIAAPPGLPPPDARLFPARVSRWRCGS
jgi:hypothetical protein